MDQGIVLLLEWMILAMDLLTLVMIYKQVSWCFFFFEKTRARKAFGGRNTQRALFLDGWSRPSVCLF